MALLGGQGTGHLPTLCGLCDCPLDLTPSSSKVTITDGAALPTCSEALRGDSMWPSSPGLDEGEAQGL